MKAIITGAAGFVGRQLTIQLLQQGGHELCLVDQDFPENYLSSEPRVVCIRGALQDESVRAEMLNRDFDTLFHLAALPGGAAEADPALSRKVNLDATLDLFEEASAVSDRLRVVYTSTIAVLGAPMPAKVDDQSPIVPPMTYGAHKAMVELALADMSRMGKLEAVTVRLPGILARPLAPSGLKSAFMSDLFHNLKAGQSFVSPVSEKATMWLMSVNQCATNLINAATVDTHSLPISRAVTLPVVRCSMAELVATVATATGASADLVRYEPDEGLEFVFGTQPPIDTPAAELAGFRNDGSLQNLVAKALENC